MYGGYHAIAWSGYCFGIPVIMFESLALFYGFLR